MFWPGFLLASAKKKKSLSKYVMFRGGLEGDRWSASARFRSSVARAVRGPHVVHRSRFAVNQPHCMCTTLGISSVPYYVPTLAEGFVLCDWDVASG